MTRHHQEADPVAGIGYDCLLCGGRAHAYSGDGGLTVEVWDLCRTCNSAFHFLAVGLELLQATAPATAPATHLLCDCGRSFRTSTAAHNHYAACPVERARSAAYVEALENGSDPWAAGRAAVRVQAVAGQLELGEEA